VPNFTPIAIGATCRPCGTKNVKIGFVTVTVYNLKNPR